MSNIIWEKLEGPALAKVVRVFGDVFNYDTDSDSIYAHKLGRKTVFARDCGGVVRLYSAGDDGRIYSIKVYSNYTHVKVDSLNILTRAAALGLDDTSKWAGVYTNGFLRA